MEDAEIILQTGTGPTRQEDEERIVERLVLQEALDTLPEKQKAVLRDFYLREKDEKRIAMERGISRQAVNGLKRRGLDSLRQEMGIQGNEKEERKK